MRFKLLVAAVQSGDKDAQKCLAFLLRENLMGFIAHIIRGSSLEVEDLYQKVCLVVFEHLHEFEDRGSGSFGRWAREIARRRALEELRKRAREAAGLAEFAHHPRESPLSPASQVTLHELGPQLDSAFDQLSELERAAILWDWEKHDGDRKDAELADLHNTTVNTIQASRSRGLKELTTRTQKMRKTPPPRLAPPPKPSSACSPKEF